MVKVVSGVGFKALQTIPDFVLVVSSQDLGHQGQGPDAVGRSMGTSDPFDLSALVEIRIGSRQNESPRI